MKPPPQAMQVATKQHPVQQGSLITAPKKKRSRQAISAASRTVRGIKTREEAAAALTTPGYASGPIQSGAYQGGRYGR